MTEKIERPYEDINAIPSDDGNYSLFITGPQLNEIINIVTKHYKHIDRASAYVERKKHDPTFGKKKSI